MDKKIQIRFLGAARNVTGSCYMLEVDRKKYLVDCGMYQERDLTKRNWDPFAFRADDIDAVLLTHAHLDHCGLLPKLGKAGFSGKIYCTPATADIAKIILIDSARIQEHDIAYKKRRHEKEGRTSPFPYEPLYSMEDVDRVLPMFSTVGYGTTVHIDDGISVTFFDGGHILGSSMIRVDITSGSESRRIIFSGDIGRGDVPIIRDPSTFETSDYVVVESTYGNRDHEDNNMIPEKLARIINRTVDGGGNIVIPSFAVERTQELLYHLHQLLAEKKIPNIPVIVDSPMAIKVTEVFLRHPELFDEDSLELLRQGKHPCDLPNLVMSRTTEESKSINKRKGSAIIIAGSGMCTGGRIKHHLRNNIGNEASTLLFIGYQAYGTLGRRLLEREESVRIHGKEYDVVASVEKINGFSAHGDRSEIYEWLSALKNEPRKVFVTHGEEDAATEFGEYIRSRSGWSVDVPEYKDKAELN